MKSIGCLAVALLLFTAFGIAAAQDQQENKASSAALPWAYNTDAPSRPAGSPVTSPDTSPQQAPGSTLSFTEQQVHDQYAPVDWFPGDHGPMPPIVAHGNKDAKVMACAYCHLSNGQGRPENAPLAGLPVEYFVKQMMDFKDGRRASLDPKKGNTRLMIGFAKAMSNEDIQSAAEYYGSIHFMPWIKVVEATTVPKTSVDVGLFLKLPGNATEPIGDRIVEMSEDVRDTEDLRDDHVGFTAYVPVGSVQKGEPLVKTGGAGKTIACGTCHGATLRGIGPVPAIAGRPASYIARQLFDMQHSARYGSWSALMTNAVVQLTPDDILDIAAYVASQKP